MSQRLYEHSVRGLSLVMVAIGAVILIATLAAGGGPLSLGVLLGVIFCVVGGGRLYLLARTRR
jgi:hypothetical protein